MSNVDCEVVVGIGITPGKSMVVTHQQLMTQRLQGPEEPQEDHQLVDS